MSIRDVARAAGVSTATVSRVLTGARSVRAESARAVNSAALQLGYQPNALGRSLRRRTTATVGMVVPRVDNPFFPAIVQMTEQLLHDRGLEMLLCTSSDDPSLEASKIRVLLNRQVDGLLISPCDSIRSAPVLEEATARVPVVQIDQVTRGWSGDFVGVDDMTGIREVVAHLRSRGKRRLAYIGPSDENSSGEARFAAFAELVPEPHGVRFGDFTVDWGDIAARSLLTGDDPPDAIVCGNDLIALGAVRAAGALGLRVPEDLAVAGFDDVDVARIMRPELTTVRQPIAALASEAVRILSDRIAGDDRDPEKVFLPTTLVVRESA